MTGDWRQRAERYPIDFSTGAARRLAGSTVLQGAAAPGACSRWQDSRRPPGSTATARSCHLGGYRRQGRHYGNGNDAVQYSCLHDVIHVYLLRRHVNVDYLDKNPTPEYRRVCSVADDKVDIEMSLDYFGCSADIR